MVFAFIPRCLSIVQHVLIEELLLHNISLSFLSVFAELYLFTELRGVFQYDTIMVSAIIPRCLSTALCLSKNYITLDNLRNIQFL